MLRTRIVTGVILGIAIGLSVLRASNLAIAAGFGVITLFAAWEWAGLAQIIHWPYRLAYTALTAACLWLLWAIPVQEFSLTILGSSALWWFAVLVLLCLIVTPTHAGRWSRAGFAGAGFLTLAPAWFAIIVLQKQDPVLALFLLLLVWMADTAAFAAGSRYGRTRLAPVISPGKTREGLWGAVAACGLFALAVGWWLELSPVSWAYFVGLSLLTVLFSVVGDLFESLLKRSAGVKDSGQILPGHGGVLDRIDSLTAAAPVFVLGLHWL